MTGVEDEEEVAALREALRQQALAVEMLKVELEEERQAASSGADEALAMILRLQAEKAAERMEAEQFRRMAEERILHDGDSLAFLKALVFHQEMDISSLKLRLLAVCGSSDPYAPAAGVDLPWLRKLAKNGVSSRRNASLPAARLEELCRDLDGGGGGGEDGDSRETVGDSTRPARTVSDIGEVIRREKEWARSPNASHLKAPPRLHRSASHRLPRAPSYPAQCDPYQGGGVHDKFEAPESVASHPPRSRRRAVSPEIISEEDDQVVSSARRADSTGEPKSERGNDGDRTTMSIAELGDAIHQIKAGVQNLATELSRTRETSTLAGDAQARLLAEIRAKLDAIATNKHEDAAHGHGDERSYTSREEGSSSKSVVVSVPQSEVLMNHFIEVCAIIFRFFLALVLAVLLGKVLVN